MGLGSIGKAIGGALKVAAPGVIGGLVDTGAQFGLGQVSSAQQYKRTKDLYQNRYQWMMKDMRKAGLNPILAGQLGAGSAGSVAAAPIGGPMNTASSALAFRRQNQELGNMRSQQRLTEAQERAAREQALLHHSAAEVNRSTSIARAFESRIRETEALESEIIRDFLETPAGRRTVELGYMGRNTAPLSHSARNLALGLGAVAAGTGVGRLLRGVGSVKRVGQSVKRMRGRTKGLTPSEKAKRKKTQDAIYEKIWKGII